MWENITVMEVERADGKRGSCEATQLTSVSALELCAASEVS